MSTHDFGDLSDNGSNYKSILFTSVLAAHVVYNADPLISLHNDETDRIDPKIGRRDEEILSYAKYNHLIEDLVFSTVYEEKLKDVINRILKKGDNLQTRYMICINEREKILFLAIRGTETKNDWTQDAKMLLTRSIYNLPGKVHAGFSIRAEQVPLEFYVNKIVNEGYRCVVTGHSLGGATATLVAVKLLFHEKIHGKSEFYKKILCICFGTPAVGNFEFAEHINKIYKENFHFYINKNDLVVLQTFTMSKIYIQFGKFIFINDDGTYVMSNTYVRERFLLGVAEDHRCTHYVENLVKILEKSHQVYLEGTERKIIRIFQALYIPTVKIEKHVLNQKCDLINGCSKFCNKYSVCLNNKKTLLGKSILFVDITICCQNAEYIYKGVLEFDGCEEKYLDLKVKRFGSCSHLIQLNFDVKTNVLKCTKAKLVLITHLEEASMHIDISKEDFDNHLFDNGQ